MAQGIYKSAEHINLVYHSAGSVTGLTPTGLVYDEGAATHVTETAALNSALAVAGNKKSEGVYLAGFQPDAEGQWTVVIDDGIGDGIAVKTYMVCGHNIDEVGDDAALAKNHADSATNSADSAKAAASSAKDKADSATNAADSALVCASSAEVAAKSAADYANSANDKADSATNAADSALVCASSAENAAKSALAAASSAAGYGATGASSAALAAVASPAGIS